MIRTWPFTTTALSSPITLAVDTENPEEHLSGFCDRFSAMVPQVEIKKNDDTPFGGPALIVGEYQNIAYQALPTAKILHNFLTVLQPLSDDHQSAVQPLAPQLNKIDLPVILKLYVSTQCPHCPQTMRQLQALAWASPNIQLKIIDAEMFSDSAQKDAVRSVPTTILDDQFRWNGPLDLQELVTMCIQRNPADLSSASLRRLIEDGDAPRVAAMMADSGQIFHALISLLTHPRWSVRLGAMVTVEYLVEAAPALADQLSDQLWQGFDHYSDSVQGDVVHVLGEVSSQANKKRLLSITKGGYTDSVRESAEEALAEM
jgi:glutaredoxin